MTNIDKIIKDVEAKLAKATPGGWCNHPNWNGIFIEQNGGRYNIGDFSSVHDAAYAAAAANAAPALVAEVKRLRVELTHAKSDAGRMRYELGIVVGRLHDRINEAEAGFDEMQGFVPAPAIRELVEDIVTATRESEPIDETHNPETCNVCQARQAFYRAAAITKGVEGDA